MKKKELQALIKPMIKEVLLEVLLQEGVLTQLVSETVSGVFQSDVLVEALSGRVNEQINVQPQPQQKQLLANASTTQSNDISRMRAEMSGQFAPKLEKPKGLSEDNPFASLVNSAAPLTESNITTDEKKRQIDPQTEMLLNSEGVDLGMFKELGLDFT